MNKLIIIIIISNLFLISCNSVRDSAGVNRKVIDEYAVVENPPLVIPPDFNLLPPEQIETKDIKDTDTDLAKEILFGLEENNGKIDTNNSLMSQILKKAEADDVDENIRNMINQEFAGEKSSINDETKFGSEEEINNAIKASENTVIKNKKEKKKKRFFFF